jgi:hypothetical protein
VCVCVCVKTSLAMRKWRWAGETTGRRALMTDDLLRSSMLLGETAGCAALSHVSQGQLTLQPDTATRLRQRSTSKYTLSSLMHSLVKQQKPKNTTLNATSCLLRARIIVTKTVT